MECRLNAAGGARKCLWPWRAEDQVQDPSRLPGPKCVGGNARCVPLILQSQRVSPHWPLFFPTSCAPRTHAAREGPRRQGPDPEAQRGSRGQVGGGNAFHASLDPLIRRAPPCPPLLPPPPSYAPRSNTAQRGPQRAEDLVWEPSRLLGAQLGRANARCTAL